MKKKILLVIAGLAIAFGVYASTDLNDSHVAEDPNGGHVVEPTGDPNGGH